MAASGGKQYGLILPQKSTSKSATFTRPSIFDDDSDEETSVGEALQKEAVKKKMMKQTRLEMQKALDEDSSVYDYDGVYDDIQKQKLESNKKLLGGTDKKPKYINQLMQAVEERKKEQERRDERKIQKEREAEGEKFADKEAYVTSAYRQKLKERQEELEKERRAAEIEAALDVKKQKDLSGFYRHLLNQTVGEEPIPDRSTERQDKFKHEKSPVINSPKQTDDHEEVHSDEDQKTSKLEFGRTSNSGHSKRHYRQRSPSSGSEDREKERKQKEKRSHKEKERDKARDREREDKHDHRKEDRDHRGDRDRHRQEEERGREKRDRERDKEKEDRHGKRNRAEGSPKVREHDRNEERGKDGDREKEKAKADHKMEEKEKKDTEEETQGDEKDAKIEKGAQVEAAQVASKFAKRSSDQTVSSARERFLARQMARSAAKPYIEKEDN